MVILNEDQKTFMIISRSFLLGTRKVSDRSCRENQNKHFMLKNFPQNCGIGEIMWKNMVQPDRPQRTI